MLIISVIFSAMSVCENPTGVDHFSSLMPSGLDLMRASRITLVWMLFKISKDNHMIEQTKSLKIRTVSQATILCS